MMTFWLWRILQWWHSSSHCCWFPPGIRSLRSLFFVLPRCHALPILHTISVLHIILAHRNLCICVPICTWLTLTCFSFAVSTKYIVLVVLLFNITGFLFVYNKILVLVVSSEDVMHMCMLQLLHMLGCWILLVPIMDPPSFSNSFSHFLLGDLVFIFMFVLQHQVWSMQM
jgi:hypothetical protein